MKLRVDPNIHDALYLRAEQEGRSMNQVAERVLAAAAKRWSASATKESKK